MYCQTHKQTECDSCRVASEHVPAMYRSSNPEFSGYELCAECRDEYDQRSNDLD